jgi:lysylphosphatidylglycerol synthetase-like protein (DUF2156 family)
MCNEAIFDTVLAVVPAYGNRVQPFRMMFLGLFTAFGFCCQFTLEMWSNGHDFKTPCCMPLMKTLHVFQTVVMGPLLFINSFAAKLKTLGLEKKPGEPSGSVLSKILADDSPNGGMITMIRKAIINTVTSKLTLFLINLALLILSMAVLMMGARLMSTPRPDGNRFFNMNYIIVIMLIAAVLVIVSFMGCGGAWSESKKYLFPYTILLGVCLATQLVGLYLFYQETKGMTPEDAIERSRGLIEQVYVDGNCTTPTNNPPPYNVTCTTPNYEWFGLMVDRGCEFAGPKDMQDLKDRVADAVVADDFDLVSQLATDLNLKLSVKTRIDMCLARYGEPIDSAKGTGVFCVCANMLATKVEMLKKLAYIVIGLLVLQFILILMAAKLAVGFDLDLVPMSRKEILDMVEGQGGNNKRMVV